MDTAGNVEWRSYSHSNVQMMNNTDHPLCDGEWHHVVFVGWVEDPTAASTVAIRPYYDGALLGYANVNMISWAGLVGKPVHSMGDGVGGINYRLDDLFFANYPLSLTTIEALYNEGAGERADVADLAGL